MPSNKFQLLSFAIARVAALPARQLDELAIADEALFEKTIADPHLLASEWARLHEKMQAFSHLAPLERSLLFASHDLLDRLPNFRRTAAVDFVKKQRQTALGLYEYLARAAAKTSPFAQLCSTQLVDFHKVEADFSFLKNMADNPRWAGMEAVARENVKLRHTLNVAILERLIDRLLADSRFAKQLRIRLNPALSHPAPNRFVFPFFDNETEAFQHLESELAEGIWAFFLRPAPDQKTDPEKLGSILYKQFEATDVEGESFVNQLISLGFFENVLPVSGQEPDWSARFLSRLAFLSPFEKQDELAALFHWLNGTAKQLGWLPVEEARAAQLEARQRLSEFLGEKDAPPAEQIWFQDAATEHELGIEPGEIERLVGSLREAVLAAGKLPVGELASRARAFFQREFGGEEVGFLEFAEAFLSKNGIQVVESQPVRSRPSGKIGAALQVFRLADGRLAAVVNALFPGGGRVMGRFLPLFPDRQTEVLKKWNSTAVGFYGQSFHNANLSPVLTELELDFHGSRPRLPAEKRASLAEASVRFDEEAGWLRAFLPKRESWLELADVALESPDSRTPVLQLLRAISQQPVSLAAMVEFLEKKSGPESGRLARLAVGDDLVFRRETWVYNIENLPKKARPTAPEIDWFSKIRAFQKKESLPRRCFYSFRGKPQLVDFQSVISLRAFQKRLEKAEGEIVFTEMLPLPEQLPGEGRAFELIVEFEL